VDVQLTTCSKLAQRLVGGGKPRKRLHDDELDDLVGGRLSQIVKLEKELRVARDISPVEAVCVAPRAVKVDPVLEAVHVEDRVEAETRQQIDDGHEMLRREEILEHNVVLGAVPDGSAVVVRDRNGAAYLLYHGNHRAVAPPRAEYDYHAGVNGGAEG